ncbi:MAG: putative amino acid transporter ATP-binding protein [Acidimicrobiales bacterium]|nr:putative amino acid transporter ATP-binding protein [Acidimicrobiales bacterium]
MTTADALTLRNLTAGYNGIAAIRDVDLVVHAGELVTLLGPNGAGKTTTLLTVCGVVSPMHGEVLLGGQRVPAGRPHVLARRGLGHVPENRGLFFELTAAQNMRLATKSKVEVDRVLELFPALPALMGRRAGVLSGGEQQMLAIARALARRPRVLMVDELSLGLAPLVVQSLLASLRNAVDDDGIAVLLIEQHIELALGAADRAYVLNHGRIALEGSAESLKNERALIESSYLGDLDEVVS